MRRNDRRAPRLGSKRSGARHKRRNTSWSTSSAIAELAVTRRATPRTALPWRRQRISTASGQRSTTSTTSAASSSSSSRRGASSVGATGGPDVEGRVHARDSVPTGPADEEKGDLADTRRCTGSEDPVHPLDVDAVAAPEERGALVRGDAPPRWHDRRCEREPGRQREA